MATPLPERSPAWRPLWRRSWHRSVMLALTVLALGGCSFDLGSLMPEKEKPQQEAPKAAAVSEAAAVSPASVTEAQTHATRGQTLAKSGQTAEALEEFNRAVALDPCNAQALYGRALIYQASNQHEFAIADFS